MNYEQEVKRVYPDAECEYFRCRWAKEMLYHVTSTLKFQEDWDKHVKNSTTGLLSKTLLKKDAWESAYKQLVKQGKIIEQ